MRKSARSGGVSRRRVNTDERARHAATRQNQRRAGRDCLSSDGVFRVT